jgi:transcriptional regulator with XRE-family HTH domain
MTSDGLAVLIGNNIRKFRKLRNLTREKLAEALNIDTGYLGMCERGERQLGLNKTIDVIQYFGITANDLITINVEQSTANHDRYVEEIQKQLERLSDNQLISVSKMISAIDNLR